MKQEEEDKRIHEELERQWKQYHQHRHHHYHQQIETGKRQHEIIEWTFNDTTNNTHLQYESYINAKPSVPLYSSYSCIGGSQVVPDKYWKRPREFFKTFPLFDPVYRTCHVKNVCWIRGELIYYEDPSLTS